MDSLNEKKIKKTQNNISCLPLILYYFFQVTKWDTEQYGSSTTTVTTTNAKISNKK